MAGLHWIRLDCAFPMNHKTLGLAADGRHRAIAVYVCGLAYAGSQGTDGWIPRGALPLLHGRLTEAKHLVEAGFWIPHSGGWQIKDWHEYQPSSEETAQRTARARSAAIIRWHGKDTE